MRNIDFFFASSRMRISFQTENRQSTRREIDCFHNASILSSPEHDYDVFVVVVFRFTVCNGQAKKKTT